MDRENILEETGQLGARFPRLHCPQDCHQGKPVPSNGSHLSGSSREQKVYFMIARGQAFGRAMVVGSTLEES